MTLKVYADRLSQPSRAVLIFCKINGIDFEEITVEFLKHQQFTPEYKEINPMSQVPAIVDGTFKLFESHAILIYLASAYPGVPDHWYPADVFKRAKIHSVLAWHHSYLRRGATGIVYHSIMAPLHGLTFDPQVPEQARKILPKSLSILEDYWLEGTGPFLFGNSEPSIADLSLVCEIMQLEFLSEKEYREILSPYKKVLKWIEDTKNATGPYFDEVHMALFNVQNEIRERMVKQSISSHKGGSESECIK
ncbi:hypothetical protein L2E82_38463 [Cichorium intybus]|uniref:Uncharacterized protein n=1 Tax=Cichorium intybus TaxID=13427 RepID=A0ACB9AFV2_CICIN|nr:hypothetical protein L2E82_38463 [Cichorium intybus]